MSLNASKVQLAGDRTVGRLVKWLRVLGISVVTMSPKKASEIPEGVLLLTRKRGWRHHPRVLFLPSEKFEEQLAFVFQALSGLTVQPFSRCLRCNGKLETVSREEVFGLVPDYVYEKHQAFRRCPECGRVYWPGTHRKRMERRLKALGLLGFRTGSRGF